MSYTYNTAGQRTVATEVGLGALTNVYDGTNGRLMTQTNRFSETTTYAYDSAGRVQRKTLHNGQYEEYTYDQRNRVMTMNLYPSGGGTPLRVEDYTLDAASQVTKLISGSQTTLYAYDNHSQLLQEKGTAGTIFEHNYTYDNNGNRLTRNDGTNSDVYTYDDGDKLLDVKRNLNNWREYVYDGAGNTTERKKWISGGWDTETLTYDWQDRMVTQDAGKNKNAEHVYNGVNTRVATGKIGQAPNNTFARDGVGVTAPVMRDSNAAYTPGTSEKRGGATTFMHSGIKNANVQTTTAGTIAATRTYDAFGNTVASTGTWKGPFGYAGQFGYQEDAGGLKLLGNRYYDAEIGRFITKDPIKDGRNWYAYCDNNPVTFGDPHGLTKGWIIEFLTGSGKKAKYVVMETDQMADDVADCLSSPGYTHIKHPAHKPTHADHRHGQLDGTPPNGKPHDLDSNHVSTEAEADAAANTGGDWKDWRKKGTQVQDVLKELLCLTPLAIFIEAGDAGTAAGQYCDEHDDDWRDGFREAYSRKAGLHASDLSW
jgi:RHS repeat-associated protein